MRDQPGIITCTRIILMGQLMVNLPVVLIVLLGCLISVIDSRLVLITVFLIVVAFRIYQRQMRRWKVWALRKRLTRVQLFKLGKIGLINFYPHYIFSDP